jgi:hypothetical protein
VQPYTDKIVYSFSPQGLPMQTVQDFETGLAEIRYELEEIPPLIGPSNWCANTPCNQRPLLSNLSRVALPLLYQRQLAVAEDELRPRNGIARFLNLTHGNYYRILVSAKVIAALSPVCLEPAASPAPHTPI